MADWLVFDSGCTEEPQVAALLMGGINSRPKAAAEWLHKHSQAALVFARPLDEELTLAGLVPNEAVLTQKLLATYGILGDRVTVLPEPQVVNTFEEVTRLLQYYKSLTPRPNALFILTGWSHSRRAAWTAEHLAKAEGVSICMVPLRQGKDSPDNWWESDQGTINVFSEYIKSLRYGVKYGLRG